MSRSIQDVYPAIACQLFAHLNPLIDMSMVSIDYSGTLTWATFCVLCGEHFYNNETINDHLGLPSHCNLCFGKRSKSTKLIPRSESVAIRYPNLFWEFEQWRNPGLDLLTFTVSSGFRINWTCLTHKTCNEHVWSAPICDRVRHSSVCGLCVPISGKCCRCHSFAANYPHLLAEYAYDLNNGLDPFTVSMSSGQFLWWRCVDHKGCDKHVWQATVSNRASKLSRCSFCSHHLKCCECDSLQRHHPKLMKEFVREFNPDIDPSAISVSSGKSVWWQCIKCQNIWPALICNRTGTNKTGCPRCRASKHEKLCEDILTFLNLPFKPQKTYTGCINDRTGRSLFFDFCVNLTKENGTSTECLSEMDGEQHFFDCRFQSRSGNLGDRNHKDQRKNVFGFGFGKHLIRVSFSERANTYAHMMTFLLAIYHSTSEAPVFHFCGIEYLEQAIEPSFLPYIKFYYCKDILTFGPFSRT